MDNKHSGPDFAKGKSLSGKGSRGKRSNEKSLRYSPREKSQEKFQGKSQKKSQRKDPGKIPGKVPEKVPGKVPERERSLSSIKWKRPRGKSRKQK